MLLMTMVAPTPSSLMPAPSLVSSSSTRPTYTQENKCRRLLLHVKERRLFEEFSSYIATVETPCIDSCLGECAYWDINEQER